MLARLWGIRRRSATGLSTPSLTGVVIRAALMLVGLGYLAYFLNIDRGIGYMPLLWVVLVVVMDLFAVGGSVEAAHVPGSG
ncbi:MAG: hypothetical protein ACR2KL_09040 [Nocardioidaceae bacterium]